MSSLPSLRPLEPVSLREEARRVIRAGIITGEIEAGEIYSAPAIAEKLSVSATPVREAILDLVNEGLVETVRNRGFRVVAYDDRDLEEIFELRDLIEVPSVARLAGQLDTEQLTHLRRHVADIEEGARRGDIALFLSADHAFHLGLLQPLGNRRLIELVTRLRDQTRLYGLAQLEHETLVDSADEHRAILDAVESGDQARAATLMRQHLRHTRGIWAGHDESEPVDDNPE